MSQHEGAAEPTSYKSWVSPATPPIFRASGRVFGFAALAVASAGFAFEFEYFRELSLVSLDYLGIPHFLMSGLLLIWFPVAFLTIWGLGRKLFTSSVATDEWAEIKEASASRSFAQEVWLARFAVCLAAVQYTCTKFALLQLGPASLFAMYAVSVMFARTALSSPGPSRATLLFWFFVSWMTCAASGGVYQARADAIHDIVRDDKVVRIERRADHYVVSAKPQNWVTWLPTRVLKAAGAVLK